jgi:hypothetical protein
MASTEQLRNYLMTLNVDPGSCRGFEDEALGACIGLVGWGWAGTCASRMAWLRAVTVAGMNRSGKLIAGPANKSFFYSAIQHRQRSAFQAFGFSAPDWSKFDASDYPWALPEPLLRALDAEVSKGKGLAGQKAASWDDVLKTVSEYKKEIGLSGPVAWFGKKLLKSFLMKYAPELAEGAVAEWGAGVLTLAAFGEIRLQQIIVPISNAEVRRAFDADRNRRNYDRLIAGAVATR